MVLGDRKIQIKMSGAAINALGNTRRTSAETPMAINANQLHWYHGPTRQCLLVAKVGDNILKRAETICMQPTKPNIVGE